MARLGGGSKGGTSQITVIRESQTLDGFSDCVRKHFDFLVQRYGFMRGGKPEILPELGDSTASVRYDGPHLFLWIHLDKNEVVVTLFVKIHTSILRPAGRRSFSLDEILRLVAPESLSSLPASETPWSAPRNYEALLKFYAEALPKYCDALLRMDLKLIEEVCLRR